MGAAPREFYTVRDMLSRAEEYRQRAGTARTADIQGALLELAQLYEEAAGQRQRATQREPELAQVA